MDETRAIERAKTAIEILRSLDGFDKIRFIILFGSAARGQERPASDVDLCIYFEGSNEEASLFRFRALSELPGLFDVRIFQQLPLYIRVEVLQGIVMYAPDKRFLYDVAWDTIKEFNSFKHRFYDYIGEESIVR